jgi:hypothetical protein
MNVGDYIFTELSWIPVYLVIAFIVLRFIKPRKSKPNRGFYGGEGNLSSLPGENTDPRNRVRKTKP